ncbi:MAG TPA: TolC family protein [Thermoanaerobaculia bacterium]|nr:TolC family protein [Thermoanaerobaculia bacterium]
MKTSTALTITACAAAFAGTLAAQSNLAPPPPATPPPPTMGERPAVSVSVSARAARAHNEPIPPATADGVHLSLRDAIALALANNVDLDVSIAGNEQGFYGVIQEKGIFDPLAFATGSVSDNETPQSSTLGGGLAVDTKTYVGDVGVSQLIPWGGTFTLGFDNQKLDTTSSFAVINPSYSSSLFLALKQPLLRNFGRDVTTQFIRIAKNTEAIDNQTYLQTLQQGITTVETAYWNLVYARANLEVKKESRDLAQELYRITKIKIDVGSQAPIDIVQTEAGVAQRELDIITATQAVGDAEDQLKRLLNFATAGRWNDHIIPTDEVRVTTVAVDVDAGVDRALQDRPEVRSAIFNAASARIHFDVAHNQLLPQADLNAQYGYAGLGGPFHVFDANGNPTGVVLPGDYSDALSQISHRDFKNWSVGLNLSFPILNRTARGAEGAARWGLQSSLATLEQVRQNVTVQVRNAGRAIETARESIVAAGKNRELQERNVDAAKKKYDNGLITAFEVLSTQTDLATARSAELQALTQYRDAMVAYHQAIGDLLGWKDVQVEGLEAIPAPDPESLRPGK